jgi:hypothetical protein
LVMPDLLVDLHALLTHWLFLSSRRQIIGRLVQ